MDSTSSPTSTSSESSSGSPPSSPSPPLAFELTWECERTRFKLRTSTPVDNKMVRQLVRSGKSGRKHRSQSKDREEKSPDHGSNKSLQAWDSELAANNADFQKLYKEMLQASKDTSMANVEILWRLAKVTYLVSLNILELIEIKAKTEEVALYAEKAIDLDANHFQANLWQASATGKLALFTGTDIVEDDLKQKLKSFGIFLKHLYVCIKLNPQDPMVLFMEGRMHLALLLLSPEDKMAMEQHLKAHNLAVPVLDLASAETKLRKSIELNPNSIDSYVTLAYLLISCKKFAEAHELINKALAVRRVTKSDEELVSDLEQLKSRLPPN